MIIFKQHNLLLKVHIQTLEWPGGLEVSSLPLMLKVGGSIPGRCKHDPEKWDFFQPPEPWGLWAVR